MEDGNTDKSVVSDAMDTSLCRVTPDCSVDEACALLLQNQAQCCVVVEKSGQVRGALGLHELLQASHAEKRPQVVREILGNVPPIVRPSDALIKAMHNMQGQGQQISLVMESGKLLGVLQLGTMGAPISKLLARQTKELVDLRAECQRKDEYFSLMARDLRAPLHTIALSTAYLLVDGSTKTLSEDQKSFVERVKRNVEAASSMIDDIFEIMRFDHGFRLNYKTIRLADLVEESLQNLQFLAAQNQLSFDVRHEQDIEVTLDPKRMRQAIDSVLIAAIKSSPWGSQIFLQAKLLQKANGTSLALQVRHQASSQGAHKKDEPERPLSQGSESLGLALARKLVENHQGSLTWASDGPEESIITVELPKANLLSKISETSVLYKGPVILLVEDDDSIREFYKQSLEELRFHVIEAADGAEGFAHFQQHPVDLVLSDIRMPNMDGLELLAKIRSSDSSVPVILCSGYYVGLEQDLSQSVHKPNRVIDKPFKVKDMIALIEDQLRRHKKAA